MKDFARAVSLQRKSILIAVGLLVSALIIPVFLQKNELLVIAWVVFLAASFVNVFVQVHKMDKLANQNPEYKEKLQADMKKALKRIIWQAAAGFLMMIVFALIALLWK